MFSILFQPCSPGKLGAATMLSVWILTSPLAQSADSLGRFARQSAPEAYTASDAATSSSLHGYTEPVRTINVASDETGTIEKVFVQDGDSVAAGEPLVRLNSQIQEAQLEVAKQQMLSEGRLDAAKAELELTKYRLDKVQSLRQGGHARQAELQRAMKEYQVAQANVRTVTEELETRRLEHQRLATQLKRRVIRAPVSGIVTEIHKQPGEFAAPNKPDVITLVQLDTLMANFALLASQANRFEIGQSIQLQFLETDQTAMGTVHYISPITEAESGTVLVKIAIDNTKGFLRSGVRCTIAMHD